MKALILSAFLTARFAYPAEALAAVIPKPIQGLIWIGFFTAVFIILISVMLRSGKAKHRRINWFK